MNTPRRSTIIVLCLVAAAGALLYLKAWPFVSGLLPIVKTSVPLPLTDDELPFELPEGFAASVFASSTPGARVLTRDPAGTIVVSLTSEGKVVALPDRDSNHKADSVVTILQDLNQPHGIVFLCGEGLSLGDEPECTLYVAEEHALKAYEYDADAFVVANPRTLISNLPYDGGHHTRTLMLHPDGEQILVSVGSSCNACHEKNPYRAAVLSYNARTGETSEFAAGLRNTVFMAIHPVTGEAWGTDMGRDNLGDDLPPDEVNILQKGKNYGWPYCYGKQIHDVDFDAGKNPCGPTHPSQLDLQAHSAPLGLAFVPEEGWPEDWWHDLLIAYHGSWNRSIPTGYKIVRFDLDPEGNSVGTAPNDFMAGFMTSDGRLVGRPVDIMIQPGGTMYVSDDRAGVIYRIFRIQEP